MLKALLASVLLCVGLALIVPGAEALTYQGGKCVAGCAHQDDRFVHAIDPACEEIKNEIRKAQCISNENDNDDNGGDTDDSADSGGSSGGGSGGGGGGGGK